MTEGPVSPINRWRTGLHPHASGMRLLSIGRVHLLLGEALRLELADVDPDATDVVHLQYYIATELGPWALWLTCVRDEVEACEASLRELAPPFSEERQP